ncbi:MAG TPA: hypothetical protein DDW29_03555 [Gammaproteobacteria bacterium]|nr:hypothetical protein [Gammaproteobacteria bacterium]
MPQMPPSKLNIEQKNYDYYAPETLAFGGIAKAKALSTLPYSVKVLLENLMRHLNKEFVDVDDIKNLANWSDENNPIIKVLPTSAVQQTENLNAALSPDEVCNRISTQLNEALETDIITINDATLMPELKVRAQNKSSALTAIYNAAGVITVQESQQQPLAKYHPVEFQMKPIVGIHISGQSKKSDHEIAIAIAEQLKSENLTDTIEFYGAGLKNLNINTRACISALLIQQGAEQAVFPIDEVTLSSVKDTNKARIKDYAQALGIWHDEKLPAPRVQREIKINISST